MAIKRTDKVYDIQANSELDWNQVAIKYGHMTVGEVVRNAGYDDIEDYIVSCGEFASFDLIPYSIRGLLLSKGLINEDMNLDDIYAKLGGTYRSALNGIKQALDITSDDLNGVTLFSIFAGVDRLDHAGSYLHQLRFGYRAIELLTAERRQNIEEKVTELSAYSAAYTTADRILTQLPTIEVVFQPEASVPAPAFTDGETVVFNMEHLVLEGDIQDFNNAISIHGLNFHEVSHLLWSPRAGSDLIKFVVREGLTTIWNLAEDARIEALLIAKYPSLAKYLTAAVITQGLDSKNPTVEYLMLAARDYLPLELRQSYKQLLVNLNGLEWTNKVESLLQEYSTLDMRDYTRPKEVLLELRNLLNEKSMDWSRQTPSGSGESLESGTPKTLKTDTNAELIKRMNCKGHHTMTRGRTKSGKEQGAALGSLQRNFEVGADEHDRADIQDSGQDSGQGAGDSGQEGGDVSGNQSGDTNRIKDDILKDLNNDSRLRQEMKSHQNAVRQITRKMQTLNKATFTNQFVTPDMRLAATKMADELTRSELEADPHWVTQQATGKLNVSRAMHLGIHELDSAFDRWAAGDLSIEVEVSVLIDCSGSMGGREIMLANESAWIIKRAVERINGKCAVYSFSTESKQVYATNEKASNSEYRFVKATNSTNPLGALRQTMYQMEDSKATIKLVVILSDGAWDWSSTKDSENIIRTMSSEGVTVATVHLGGRYYTNGVSQAQLLKQLEENYRHHADVFWAIDKANELPKIVKSMLVSSMAKFEAA